MQVNIWQKLLFLHYLTYNMTTDCSLIYQFSAWKLQSWQLLLPMFSPWIEMFSPCSELIVFMRWIGKSMNNLFSYCGLVDTRISASEKDLPVYLMWLILEYFWNVEFESLWLMGGFMYWGFFVGYIGSLVGCFWYSLWSSIKFGAPGPQHWA